MKLLARLIDWLRRADEMADDDTALIERGREIFHATGIAQTERDREALRRYEDTR